MGSRMRQDGTRPGLAHHPVIVDQVEVQRPRLVAGPPYPTERRLERMQSRQQGTGIELGGEPQHAVDVPGWVGRRHRLRFKSETRRDGGECVQTGDYMWSPDHAKKKE